MRRAVGAKKITTASKHCYVQLPPYPRGELQKYQAALALERASASLTTQARSLNGACSIRAAVFTPPILDWCVLRTSSPVHDSRLRRLQRQGHGRTSTHTIKLCWIPVCDSHERASVVKRALSNGAPSAPRPFSPDRATAPSGISRRGQATIA